MKDYRLDQPREWRGHWWRPDHPGSVSAGVLTYTPGHNLELHLIGGWPFRERTEVRSGSVATHQEVERWPVIHGKCGSSELTLIEPWLTNAIGPYDGDPDEMMLGALTLIDGCHLDASDDAIFIGAGVTVENLTGWDQRGQSEVRPRHRKKPGADGDREDRRRSAVAFVGDIEATLYSNSDSRSMRMRRDGRTETRRTEASVSLISETPRPMEDWLSLLGGVSDLVSLSTMTACADLTIQLALPPAPELLREGHPFANHRRWVDVYQRHIVQPDPEGAPAVWPDFVLSVADLPWAQLFPAWMDVRERFSAARSMILGLRYITSGYLDSRVVTAVGAAEAFHRALECPPPIDQEEFDKLRQALLDAVPKERKSWVHDRFQRNEPSLKQRLVELATRPGSFMTELVPDPAMWARIAVRARNDLAHMGDAGEDFEQLVAVVEVTSAVVIVNLLHEIGVPARRLQAALTQHSEFKLAAELARKHFTKPRMVPVVEG